MNSSLRPPPRLTVRVKLGVRVNYSGRPERLYAGAAVAVTGQLVVVVSIKC